MSIKARTSYAVSKVSEIINRRYNSGAMPIIAVVDTFISTIIVVALLKYLGVAMAWHEVMAMVVLADVVVLALIGLSVNQKPQVVTVNNYYYDNDNDEDDIDDNEEHEDNEDPCDCDGYCDCDGCRCDNDEPKAPVAPDAEKKE